LVDVQLGHGVQRHWGYHPGNAPHVVRSSKTLSDGPQIPAVDTNIVVDKNDDLARRFVNTTISAPRRSRDLFVDVAKTVVSGGSYGAASAFIGGPVLNYNDLERGIIKCRQGREDPTHLLGPISRGDHDAHKRQICRLGGSVASEAGRRKAFGWRLSLVDKVGSYLIAELIPD